jgi:hypothetical protein
MEKYIQAAYEAYRQDVKDNYLSYTDFKKKLSCANPVPHFGYTWPAALL